MLTVAIELSISAFSPLIAHLAVAKVKNPN